MKKIFAGICVLVIGLYLGIKLSDEKDVSAQVITETYVVSEDAVVTGEILLGGISGNAFVIKNGAKLVVSDCKITSNGNGITNVFYVEQGGQLVLNNVELDYTITGTNGIYNKGCIELNGASFSNGLEYSIYQDSSQENSFKLVNATFVKKIFLSEGYLTITEETVIDSKIGIRVENYVSGSVLLVNTLGDNVFASRWINMFDLDIDEVDNVQCLDYVGENINPSAQDVNGSSLSSGDIIIASFNSSYDIGLLKMNEETYSTGRYYLEYFDKQDTPVTIKGLTSGKYMNNIDCCAKENYKVEECGAWVSLTIEVKKGDSLVSKKEYYYPSGSDWGIFVDVPSGTTLSSSSPVVSNSALSIMNICQNSQYLRCRVAYLSTELEDIDATICFTFEEEKEYGNVTVTKENNVLVEYPQSMEVGNFYTFSITKSADCVITGITFNGEGVLAEGNNGVYTFTSAIMLENTLSITSYTLVEVEPKDFAFEYGEEVVLSQTCYVASVNQNILVTFPVENNTRVGVYSISGVECDDARFVVYLKEGDWTYSISQKNVGLEGVEYNEMVTVVYSENLVLSADLFVTHMPDYLTCTPALLDGDLKAGSQSVVLTFACKNFNYSLTQDSVTVRLVVSPKEITSSHFTVTRLIATYDGEPKNVEIEGLENYLTAIIRYTQDNIENIPVNAGEYEVTVDISSASQFYTCNISCTETLLISPKSITVELEEDIFDFSGNVPSLKGMAIGVRDGDSVEVILEDIYSSDVGDYSVRVLGVNNANYSATTSTLNYSIKPIKLGNDVVSFDDNTVVYDGRPHMPILREDLPQGITYHIEDKECINVGTYTVTCTFLSNTANILPPDDVRAKVVIEPKEIRVIFTEPRDMVANGERKQISVEFLDTLENDEVEYTITYNGDCILAGNYLCTVNLLAPSNYVIANNPTHKFTILLGSTSYVTDDVNVTLRGKFKPNGEVGVKDITRSVEIVGAIADMEVASYTGLRVNVDTAQNIQVSIQAHNVTNFNNLRLYMLQDGRLTMVKYTLEDDVICFSIDGPNDLILIELKQKNKALTIIVTIAIFVLLIVVVLLYINSKKKRGGGQYFISSIEEK